MPTEYFLAHIWLIPLFPLAGAALMLFIGRRLPNAAVNVVCVGSVFLAMCFAFGAIWQLVSRPATERVVSYNLFDWVPAGIMHTNAGRVMDFNVPWGVLMDPLTAVMLLVVTGVGFLIHVYSTGYMAHEGGYYRFFGYLNLFMFSMLTLVLANNLLLLFVGWEGVGLCSYLLIGFYFLRKSASDAGKKAFIVNRIGDAGFLLGLFLMLGTLGTIQFTEMGPAIAAGHFAMGDATLTAIALLLFVGATGKSAQLPLYVWLPDAMEGPTPVSALIHAATMVTAGVYMIARTNAVFSMAPKGAGRRGRRRLRHFHFRGDDGPGAERHQARAGLFDRVAAGLHVPRLRRRRVHRGRVPLDDACVLQGLALPRIGQRDSLALRRTGHAQDGRAVGEKFRRRQKHLSWHRSRSREFRRLQAFSARTRSWATRLSTARFFGCWDSSRPA